MALTAREKRYWATKERTARIETLEFYHSEAGLKRVALNQFSDKTLTLESDAPRDPSTAVAFAAVAGKVSEPQQTAEVVSVRASFAKANQAVKTYLNSISNLKIEPLQMIVRYYFADDTSAPSRAAALYYVNNADISGGGVTFQAVDRNPRGKSVSTLMTEDNFKGLAGNI